jgi:hypothetical protein
VLPHVVVFMERDARQHAHVQAVWCCLLEGVPLALRLVVPGIVKAHLPEQRHLWLVCACVAVCVCCVCVCVRVWCVCVCVCALISWRMASPAACTVPHSCPAGPLHTPHAQAHAAARTFSSLPAEPMTLQPYTCFSSWPATSPTAPAAPDTKATSPACGSAIFLMLA